MLSRLKYFIGSFAFLGSIIISALISYFLLGSIKAIPWTAFGVLSTYSLYSAKESVTNFYNILFWIFFIILGAYVGSILKLSIELYVFIVVLSYIYYTFFGRDAVFDRGIRFVIILTVIGSSFHVTDTLPIGLIIGFLTSFGVSYLLTKKDYDFEAFKYGLFSSKLFKINSDLVVRSLIYSSGLFVCLLIAHFLKIPKIYWTVITYLMVLNPKAQNVFKLSIQRFSGTFVAVLLLVLIYQLPDLKVVQSVTLFVAAFFLPLAFQRNYGIVSFGVTLYVLSLIEYAGFLNDPEYSILFDRLLETLLGGIFAIVVSFFLKRLQTKIPIQ